MRLPFPLSVLALAATICVLPAQNVSVWLTTHNQSKLLQQQAPISFGAGSAGTNCILVDETQTFQQIEGFGAAFTDTTGYVLNQLATPAARTNALRALFARTGSGIGLNFMRIPMGASDLARFHYSYDDLPAGQTDTNLASFSVAHDEADIIPLVQQALALNPQMKLMANPWSPPGWMKTSGSMIGGSLLSTMHRPFANYFVKFIQAYSNFNIPIHYISLQNEPLYVPGDYPGMSLDAATQTILLRDHFLPVFASNQIAARLLVYDHNYDRADYPDTVYADSTLRNSSQVAGTAWHGYGGNIGVMLPMANKYPTKGNYQTEHSGGTWVSDQLRTDFEEIIHVLRSSARAFVKWNLAGDQDYGPHAGGCGTCMPLVMVNRTSGAASYTIDFYTLGHFSKFVLPGAYRIFSGNVDGLLSVAFANPDGSKALIAFNDTTGSRAFQVQWGTNFFNYTLASYSGVTFSWTGEQAGLGRVEASSQVLASSFSAVSDHQTEPCSDTTAGYNIGYANSGSFSLFRNVDFRSGYTNVSARLASAGSGGTLDFRLDSATGPLLGTVSVPVTGGWQTWQTVIGAVSGSGGVHDLYAVFRGGSSIGNFNWFQFSGAVAPPPAPWTTADVGAVGLAGSATVNGGVFVVKGSGADIEGAADAFRYLFQPVGAECELRARVDSVQNTHGWAKAGVMLRGSASGDAVNAAILITPANGIAFQRRLTPGGPTSTTVVPAVTAPRWVRLACSGGNVRGFYSSDGTNWSQIGAAAVNLGESYLAGVAVTAHNNSALCSANFANVTLNQAPSLAGISNQALMAGRTLSITNSGSDLDVPPQSLVFDVLNAPPYSTFDTGSGAFSWRPAIGQSPSSRVINFVVTDNGVPPLSATQAVAVTVQTPPAPLLTSSPSPGGIQFLVVGSEGPDYTIQASTNLFSWELFLTTNSPALPLIFAETNLAFAARYFRVLLGP